MMHIDTNLDKSELKNIPYEMLPQAILEIEKESQLISQKIAEL